jgi:hypothetical protein
MVVAESADLSYNEREHQQTMRAQWDRRMELLTFVTKNMAVPPIFRDSYRTLPNSSGGLITLLSPSHQGLCLTNCTPWARLGVR